MKSSILKLWISAAVFCIAPLFLGACVSLEPFRAGSSVGLDERAKERLFQEHVVRHPAYFPMTVGGKLLPYTQWGELEEYYADSGDVEAANEMKQWKGDLALMNTFGLVGGVLIVAGSSQKDQPSLAGTWVGIGVGSMLVACGIQIHGNEKYLHPAAEHFNNFMKKDLELTGGYERGEWRAFATLRLP